MPFYEYLCPRCNRIFSFFSHRVNPAETPPCPKCGGKKLKKRLSRFAVLGADRKSTGTAAASGPDAAAGGGTMDRIGQKMDDPRMAGAMDRLMQEAGGLDESDPRQLGRFMRKMAEVSGEPVDRNLETAIRRLEKGEDPEAIEADMGDVLGGEGAPGGRGEPAMDEGTYSF